MECPNPAAPFWACGGCHPRAPALEGQQNKETEPGAPRFGPQTPITTSHRGERGVVRMGSPSSGQSRGAPVVTAESQPDRASGKSAPRQVRRSVHQQDHVPGPRGSGRAQGQGSARCPGAEGAGGGTDGGCAAPGAQEAQQTRNPTRASRMIRAWFWKTSPRPPLPAPSQQLSCGEGASGGTSVAERMGGVEQEKHPQQGPSAGRRGAARWHTPQGPSSS